MPPQKVDRRTGEAIVFGDDRTSLYDIEEMLELLEDGSEVQQMVALDAMGVEVPQSAFMASLVEQSRRAAERKRKDRERRRKKREGKRKELRGQSALVRGRLPRRRR